MAIQLLSQNLINQIAAGEVIERPSSVIKELMENSIDADATEITVHIIDAGKSFISVSDNGIGMDKESLELCVLSHATSKLNSENLFDIRTFGFRGEALPSMASVSRLSVSSARQSSDGWRLKLEGMKTLELAPVNRNLGTTIEVRDLFFATPARLKFLKSNNSEAENCKAVFDRIALAFRGISFKFVDTNREKSRYAQTDSLKKRIEDIFGETFIKNMFEISSARDGLKFYGYIGVPTFNKASTAYQYFFVNNRFVKDKIFASALKSAYSGLIPSGRHAAAIVFLEIPFDEVDVNAHPAKIEIRFKNSEQVRFFLVSELKKALSAFGTKCPTTELMDNFYAKQTLENNRINKNAASYHPIKSNVKPANESPDTCDPLLPPFDFSRKRNMHFDDRESIKSFPVMNQNRVLTNIDADIEKNVLHQQGSFTEQKGVSDNENGDLYLGQAIYQVNCTYVIAINSDGLVIVDQHAAAERMMLEELKSNLKLDSQNLLIPEVCLFSEAQVNLLKINDDLLRKLGIYADYLSKDLIAVNSLPAMLETSNVKPIITDIIDELSMFGDIYSIDEKIHSMLSSMACHGSIRAGKRMSVDEMNHLLRRMEKSANVAQCCHGRPSYMKISIKDLDKFFERS